MSESSFPLAPSERKKMQTEDAKEPERIFELMQAGLWQSCTEKVEAAVAEIERDMCAQSIDEDSAFNLANLVSLHMVFWRHTVAIAVADRRGHDMKSVLQWIEREFRRWDNLFADKDEITP